MAGFAAMPLLASSALQIRVPVLRNFDLCVLVGVAGLTCVGAHIGRRGRARERRRCLRNSIAALLLRCRHHSKGKNRDECRGPSEGFRHSTTSHVRLLVVFPRLLQPSKTLLRFCLAPALIVRVCS